MRIIQRIRKAAYAKGWSLARLATECGLMRTQLYQIAAGKRGTSKHLPAIAAALGVSTHWLRQQDPVAVAAGLGLPARISELEKRVARLEQCHAADQRRIVNNPRARGSSAHRAPHA